VFKLDLRARQRAKAAAAASAASVGGRRASLASALDVSPHAARGDDRYEVRAAWSPASPSSTVSGSIRSGPPGSVSPHAAALHDGFRPAAQAAERDDTADQHALGPALSASALLLPHEQALSAPPHPFGAVLGEAGDPLRLGVSPRSPATGDAGVQPPASSNSARSQRSSGSALLASPARAEEGDGSSRDDRTGKEALLPAAVGGEGVPHSAAARVRDVAAKDVDAALGEVEPGKQQWAAEALAAASRSHLPELAGAREMLAAATQHATAAEERAIAAEQAATADKAALAAAEARLEAALLAAQDVAAELRLAAARAQEAEEEALLEARTERERADREAARAAREAQLRAAQVSAANSTASSDSLAAAREVESRGDAAAKQAELLAAVARRGQPVMWDVAMPRVLSRGEDRAPRQRCGVGCCSRLLTRLLLRTLLLLSALGAVALIALQWDAGKLTPRHVAAGLLQAQGRHPHLQRYLRLDVADGCLYAAQRRVPLCFSGADLAWALGGSSEPTTAPADVPSTFAPEQPPACRCPEESEQPATCFPAQPAPLIAAQPSAGSGPQGNQTDLAWVSADARGGWYASGAPLETEPSLQLAGCEVCGMELVAS